MQPVWYSDPSDLEAWWMYDYDRYFKHAASETDFVRHSSTRTPIICSILELLMWLNEQGIQ